MNEYERKFQAAQNELIQAGIWLRNAPIPFKLHVMRSLGLKPRPFNYCAYWQLLIGQRLLAALGSAGYHFTSERLWPNKERPLMQLVEESVMLGVAVGGVITIRLFKVVLKTARKSGLSNLQSL